MNVFRIIVSCLSHAGVCSRASTDYSILRILNFPMNKHSESGRHYDNDAGNLRHAQILHVRNFWPCFTRRENNCVTTATGLWVVALWPRSFSCLSHAGVCSRASTDYSILRILNFPMNKHSESGRHYDNDAGNLRHAQILHVRNFWPCFTRRENNCVTTATGLWVVALWPRS